MLPAKISIITVCYNSAKTIEQTIQSVLSQDYAFVEYIIIDGVSKDETLSVVNKYQDNISLIVSEPDKGIYDAMNKGISKATGEIIGFLNADDLYADESVISRVASAMQSPDIEACYGDLIYFQDKAPDKILRYWQSNPFRLGLFSKGWCPPHPTFFVRRAVYERYGVFNTTYKMGNDVELMMRFLEKDKIKTSYISQVLVKMRAGGVSNSGFKNILLQNKSILQAARALDLPFSTFGFVLGKIVNRLSQFIFKPAAKNYVR